MYLSVINSCLKVQSRQPICVHYTTVDTTAGVTCGAGSANTFGAPEITQVFSRVRVTWSLFFYVVLCRSLFVLWFVLVIVLSGPPQFTASNYHIGICNFTIVPTGHNSGQESGVCTNLNLIYRGHRDRTVVGFTTTYANSTYHH